MSSGRQWLRNIAIGVAVVLSASTLAAILIARTEWFRDFVRKTIISSVAESTGGRVEMGAFDFDERHLHATVRKLTIHGTERVNEPAFVSIALIDAEFRLLPGFRHLYEISSLRIEQPKVNIHDNVPVPRKKSSSDESPLKTVVDLRVRHFALTQGAITFRATTQPLEIRADDFHAKVDFNSLRQAYDGEFAMEPVYVINGVNTPVRIRLNVPVSITQDRLTLRHATMTTPLSQVAVEASLEDAGVGSVTVNGHIAGADIAAAGNAGRRLPDLAIDFDAFRNSGTVTVKSLHATFGHSNIDAAGNFRDGLQVKAFAALPELAQAARAGSASINAVVKLDDTNRYDAKGDIDVRNLAVEAGGQLVSNVGLQAAFHADPQKIDVIGARLSASGGEFTGDASLADLRRFQITGRLQRLNIRSAVSLPWDGDVSGTLDAHGDTADRRSIEATAHLAIRPGKQEVPLSGRLNAVYRGIADDVRFNDSYLALPHSRLDLNGSLGDRLNLTLMSRDLHDLLPGQPEYATFTGDGRAEFHGTVTGAISDPRITGHFDATRFAIQGRPFESLTADVSASKSRGSLSNMLLARNTMRARVDGSLALQDWTPVQTSPITLQATVENGDLGDVMVLAGRPDSGYSGVLSASAQVGGVWGNPVGTVTAKAINGTIADEPFTSSELRVDLTDQQVNLQTGYIEGAAGRLDFSGGFRHPRETFLKGELRAHVQSGGLDFGRAKHQDAISGMATINADVRATLEETAPRILVSSLDGDASAKSLQVRGVKYGDLSANARTNGGGVGYSATSNFAGSNIRITGHTELRKDYPGKADIEITSLPVDQALMAVAQSGVPARGLLSASLHVDGPMMAPRGDARIELTKASLYDEPIDQARLRASFSLESTDVSQLEIISGPSRIEASGRYLQNGRIEFRVANSRIDLAHVANVQKFRPGLRGIVDLSADGAADVRGGGSGAVLTGLNANLAAVGIAAQGKQFGDLKLTANSQGQRVVFALDSNIAGSNIQGRGNAGLTGQYPVDAQVSFQNVAWSRISDLIGRPLSSETFEAATDGELNAQGPLLDAKQLNGSLNLSKLVFTTMPNAGARRPVSIANQGPISITLNRGTLQIQNAHLTGPQTDIQASGSGTIAGENLNLTLRANTDIGILRDFDTDIYSAGQVSVSATIRGNTAKPLVDGQMKLVNAGFSTPKMPVGITNANGTVLFNRDSARIQTLTAESGGGRLTVSGTAAYSDTLRFALKGDARNVRIRVQQGVSLGANASIAFASVPDGSRLTGTATVTRLTYAPQSDFGSILARSGPSAEAPADTSAFLTGMKLDIRVRNSPGMTVESSLSQDLQADVDLRVSGTAAEPAAQGRITVSEGKLVFFGTTYSVNRGTVSFFNPLRIEPVLDVSLAAQAQGVNVTLQVTGSPENMKLSYTSDPPLQFEEIIALLASGKTPTSDPTLLANQPSQPQQGLQQTGESAILGQAVASPVANQMQRVFGVTQLKIDPSFTTGSNVPTARLALQQRITNNLTFTYVSAIDQPNSTVIRMEWAFNPQWSAVATRDQNGIFSVNFFYKREFR